MKKIRYYFAVEWSRDKDDTGTIPRRVVFLTPAELEEAITDALSDKYGWLHNGWTAIDASE